MSKWTAGEIGAYDQYLAGADAEVDRLVTTLRIGMAEVGEHQAMANVGLAISMMEPSEVTGLLTAALRRLATAGGQADSD